MPWGSYGEMLWQGIYCYDKDTNSHMIFRTGAFCPSIYRSQYNRESPVNCQGGCFTVYYRIKSYRLCPSAGKQGKDCKIGLGELGFTITGAFDISVWKYGCGRIYYTAQT